jgi:hypothetical protein
MLAKDFMMTDLTERGHSFGVSGKNESVDQVWFGCLSKGFEAKS